MDLKRGNFVKKYREKEREKERERRTEREREQKGIGLKKTGNKMDEGIQCLGS